MSGACHTTRHCADHGWCRRCDPRFADLMGEVNLIIQQTCADEQAWGLLYAQIAKVLHGEGPHVPHYQQVARPEVTVECLRQQLEHWRALPGPALGTSVYRWWDQRLKEFMDALRKAARAEGAASDFRDG